MSETILDQKQIVMPSSHVKHTNEYLFTNRVYLLHVIDLNTGKCYCGRSADGWDMPYRDEATLPTIEQILSTREFCKQCIKALKGHNSD